MKLLILAAIFGLQSCNNAPVTEQKKEEFTQLQKEYLASLTLEGKVYMEGCLNEWYNVPKYFNSCLREYRKLGQAPVVKGGPSTGAIAVGTGLGIIGAKVLTGK